MQATKSGEGHRRPRRTRSQHGRPPYRRGSRIALGTLTAVLVVLVLGAYGLGQMRDRAASQALAVPSAAASCPRAQGPPGAGCAASAPGVADGTRLSGTGLSGGEPAAWPSRPVHRRAAAKISLASPAPTTSPSSASPAPSPSPAPSQQASPPPTGASAQSAALQVLAVINQARAQAGLPAYTLSAGLAASSRAHTLVMAGGCGLAHQCPGEAAIGIRLTQAGVSWSSYGENVGEGGPEPDTAAAIAQMAVGLTQDMLNEQPPDDGHRLNILSSSYRSIGISVLRDTNGNVWMTQDFSG